MTHQIANIIAKAQSKNWCARWGCTTCGATKLRDALSNCLRESGSPEAFATEVANQQDFPPTDVHEFTLRWLSQQLNRPLEALLGAFPAGILLKRMLSAKRAADERRAEYALRNSPAFIEAERARKKAKKAARHQARLEAKKVRDAHRREIPLTSTSPTTST